MGERLIIKNFGPIKRVDLEFKKVNVLIGEQGTGKSALAKLLYLLSNSDFLFNDNEKRKDIIDLYGLFFKKNTEIHYRTNQFEIKLLKGKFSVVFQGDINRQVKEFLQYRKEFESKDRLALKNWLYFKDWAEKGSGAYKYVPAERIALFTALRFMLNTSNRSLYQNNFDQYILDYANLYNTAAEKITQFGIPHLTNVAFKKENGFDKVDFNGESLFLYQTSSGFQVSIPLVVFFEYFNSPKMGINKFIVEEPELNLFPTAQYGLIKFFIEKINPLGNTILFTTHSPYILTSLNNLLQAYISGSKKGNGKKVSEIILKKYWLNPDKVSAYILLPNGKCENIFDKEQGLIKAERIDGVSSVLNEQFDSLLNLEFKGK